VLLTLIGVYFYQKRYPLGAPSQSANNEANSVLVPETGKRVGGVFRTYFDTHGGVRQQGLPISDEFIEISATNGQPYKVQYFERAIMEYHPEYANTPNAVLLSLVGVAAWEARYNAPTVPPTATPIASQPTTVPPTNTPIPPPPAPTNTPDPCGLPAANSNVTTFPSTRCGRVGTVFLWTARGFQPNEEVGAYITLPDQAVFGAPFHLNTDGQGRILGGVSFQVPPGYPTGVSHITFEGVSSHTVQIEAFAITP
jgi:hypothetical protein